MKLDKINKKILQILQENSSITNTELSSKIGLAPASTLERVKKLEKNGIIDKYVALLNAEKVGKSTMVFVIINLLEHSVENITGFKDRIHQLPEVLECHRLAGEKDYILKIVVDDIKSYDAFTIEKLAKIPGIARMSSYFVLSTTKQETQIPIT